MSPSGSVPRSLLFNATTFFEHCSFILIHCEIQEDPAGREANVLVLGFQQCDQELVYWEGREQTETGEHPQTGSEHPQTGSEHQKACVPAGAGFTAEVGFGAEGWSRGKRVGRYAGLWLV